MPPEGIPPPDARPELILRHVDSLPTLSPIATRLLELGSAADADLAEIAALLESDPAMTARILALCRRANTGLGSKITSVRQAVVMLGLEAVQAAVLSVNVYEVLDATPRPEAGARSAAGDAFDRRGFWKHSIAVACASELLAREQAAPGVTGDEAFVAGLLHDLGKIVLDLLMPRAFDRVLRLADQRQCGSAAVAREVLGLDHHAAGKRLAEHWGLPHALQDVMWLHSQPWAAVPDLPHRRLIGVATAGKAIARSMHLGWSGEFSTPPDVALVCRDIGLDPARAMALAPRLHETVADRCRALGLESRTSHELLLQSIVAANAQLGRVASMMGRRVRAADQQARVNRAIQAYFESEREAGLDGTVAAVAASAAELVSARSMAILFQPRPGARCRVWVFGPGGSPAGEGDIDAPQSLRGPRGSLALLTDPGSVSVGALGLAELAPGLETSADRRVRLAPLISGADGGPAAVLAFDSDGSWDPVRGPAAAAFAAWGSALGAAARHEGSLRLAEQLAGANRSLGEAQDRLTEAQSLARLGELAAGAAHEMNNPLTVISGRAQLLAAGATGEPDRSSARAIVAAAEELSDLITSLKLIADPPAPRPIEADAAQVAREGVTMAEQRTGVAGHVAVEAHDGPCPVVLDREWTARALSELVSNALEASPEGYAVVRVHAPAATDRLIFAVEDRGPGMSPRALQHAFDPFFSEKPAGRQTGLGLTRARRLVELQGGSLTLRSSPGSGTVATIDLPRRPGSSAPRARGLAA